MNLYRVAVRKSYDKDEQSIQFNVAATNMGKAEARAKVDFSKVHYASPVVIRIEYAGTVTVAH